MINCHNFHFFTCKMIEIMCFLKCFNEKLHNGEQKGIKLGSQKHTDQVTAFFFSYWVTLSMAPQQVREAFVKENFNPKRIDQSPKVRAGLGSRMSPQIQPAINRIPSLIATALCPSTTTSEAALRAFKKYNVVSSVKW